MAGPLVFDWDFARDRSLAIAGFLALSLGAHAVCLYLFQIVYPPTVALLPAPVRLSLITPESEEGRTLLRWVEAEDPALASRTQRPPGLTAFIPPKLEHIPSYIAREPRLKPLPPLAADLSIPSAQPPGPVPITHPRAAQKIGLIPTQVTFSEEIEKLGAPLLPSLKFNASAKEAPQALNFRIAISGRGEILYAFPVNSSGDPALDEQAQIRLALCRFPRSPTDSDQNLVWGTATVEWGNDVIYPRSTTTSSPTP